MGSSPGPTKTHTKYIIVVGGQFALPRIEKVQVRTPTNQQPK